MSDEDSQMETTRMTSKLSTYRGYTLSYSHTKLATNHHHSSSLYPAIRQITRHERKHKLVQQIDDLLINRPRPAPSLAK